MAVSLMDRLWGGKLEMLAYKRLNGQITKTKTTFPLKGHEGISALISRLECGWRMKVGVYYPETTSSSAYVECTVPGFSYTSATQFLLVRVALNMRNYNAGNSDIMFGLYPVSSSILPYVSVGVPLYI